MCRGVDGHVQEALRQEALRQKARPDIIEALSGDEAIAVLAALLEDNPDLRPRATELATRVITDIDEDSVAAKVAGFLLPLDMINLGDRPFDAFGYQEPTETAWEVLYETVQPFIDNACRLAGLGQVDAAIAATRGVLGGLAFAEKHSRDDLISYAPDFPAETAAQTIDAVRKALGRMRNKSKLFENIADDLPLEDARAKPPG